MENSHPLLSTVDTIEPQNWIINPLGFEKYKECYAVGKQGIKTGDITSERGFVWGAGMSIRKKAWEEINQKGFRFFSLVELVILEVQARTPSCVLHCVWLGGKFGMTKN